MVWKTHAWPRQPFQDDEWLLRVQLQSLDSAYRGRLYQGRRLPSFARIVPRNGLRIVAAQEDDLDEGVRSTTRRAVPRANLAGREQLAKLVATDFHNVTD